MLQLIMLIFFGVECYRRSTSTYEVWRNITFAFCVTLALVLGDAALRGRLNHWPIATLPLIVWSIFCWSAVVFIVGWGCYGAKRLIRRVKS